MNTVELSNINKIDVLPIGIAGTKQYWKDGDKWNYLTVPRSNSGFLIVLCKRVIYTFANGEKLVAEKNSVVYMPQGCRYLVSFEQDETPVFPATVLIQFTLLDAERRPLLLDDKLTILTRDENKKLEKYFLRVAEGYLTNDKLLLHRDFLTLLYALTQTAEGEINPLKEILDYIASNLNELTTVRRLAKKFAMSESTLRRAFVKNVGRSPVQYMHAVKIERAKLMLAIPENTVEEIGAELGFFDAAHFNKVFRKYVGRSPRAYREETLKG